MISRTALSRSTSLGRRGDLGYRPSVLPLGAHRSAGPPRYHAYVVDREGIEEVMLWAKDLKGCDVSIYPNRGYLRWVWHAASRPYARVAILGG
jgi:hypothetical protein